MKAKRTRYKKKTAQKVRDKNPGSAKLRSIGEYIQAHDYRRGLAQINQELAGTGGSRIEPARLLGLVADSEFKRGAFAEAAGIYSTAATRALAHPVYWLRPLIGQVRSHLKGGQPDEARLMARHACALARHKEAAFERSVVEANRLLHEQGRVFTAPRPPRLSVVASRLGALFLQDGELGAAREFYDIAAEISPRGACRAHQGLAQIALAEGDPARAFTLASQAIRNGNFAAKTMAAWPIMIAARWQLGGWQISENLLDGLKQAPASVRARTIVLIVRELRNRDMRQWMEVAERWLKGEGLQFPSEAAELRKILLACALRSGQAPRQRLRRADDVRAVPGLSALEWLAASKAWMQAQLELGEVVALDAVVAEGARKYGNAFVGRICHALARVAAQVGKDDLARIYYERARLASAAGLTGWGRAVWAQARLENRVGRYAQAAGLYQQYVQSPETPERFRVQARVEWIRALVKAGGQKLQANWRDELLKALGELPRPDILLDTARQLRVVDDELARRIFAMGEAQLLTALDQAQHPAQRLEILFQLTRRRVSDFGYCRPVIHQWESMEPELRLQLWSEKEQYWELLSYILEAYLGSGRECDGERWSREVQSDATTPAVGRVHLAISQATWLTRRPGRMGEALTMFRAAIDAVPNHKRCAIAYLWESLAAYRKGDLVAAAGWARRVREVQGAISRLELDLVLEAKSRILEVGLDLSRLMVAGGDRRDYQLYRQELVEDLALLEGRS